MVVRLILALLASSGMILGQPHPPVTAAAVEVNIWESFRITETSCTGERVVFNMRVHFVRTLTEARSGNTSEVLHLTSVGGIATGPSGAKYLLRDGSNSMSTGYIAGDAAETFTATIRFRLIRAGEAPTDDDLYFRALFHVTVSPDGDVIVQFDKISEFECR